MKTDRPGWGLWSLPHPTHCSYPAPPTPTLPQLVLALLTPLFGP